jgi:chromosomal replication initiator protein
MYGISYEDFIGSGRASQLVRARFAAAYVLRFYGMSYPEIGRKIGGRDHTTMLHAVNRAETCARFERGFSDVIAELFEAACPGASASVQLPQFERDERAIQSLKKVIEDLTDLIAQDAISPLGLRAAAARLTSQAAMVKTGVPA